MCKDFDYTQDRSPSLILKESCNPTTMCNHISLYIGNVDWTEQELPWLPPSTQYNICQYYLTVSMTPHLTLTVVQTGSGRSSRTLVVSKQGACKLYSIPIPLEVILDNDITMQKPTLRDKPMIIRRLRVLQEILLPRNHPSISLNNTPTLEKEEERPRFALGRHNKVSFFFCKRNALRPVIDNGS